MLEYFKDAYAFIETSFGASFVVAMIGVAAWELSGYISNWILPWLRRKLKLDKGGESDG